MAEGAGGEAANRGAGADADAARAEAAGEIRAAGAVVCRRTAAGDEVSLIHRIKYGDWTFPKGKLEPGEHVLEAAVREVAEETGIPVILGRRLSPTRYDLHGRPKQVEYWAARPAPGASTGFVPNSEVDDLNWAPVAAAIRKLSYRHDARLLTELAAGPRDTIPFILLRHNSAEGKGSWPGDDLSRPLDSAGAAGAERLAGLLSCFGPCRVISSAAERCLATVRPYAQLVGAEITVQAALRVEHALADSAAAMHLAAAIAAEARPTLLCAHRENLPPVLAAICGYLDAAPPSGPELDKGGFWVLHTADSKLASAEQHSPARADACRD